MTMATSVALPAVRHPVVLAKSLAILAVLHAGPFIAGIGPGSGRADYAAVGVPFPERWTRFDEAARILRAVLRGEDRIDVGTGRGLRAHSGSRSAGVDRELGISAASARHR